MRSVPDEWREAEVDAPDRDDSPLKAKRSVKVLPTGEKADITTGVIAALIISAVSGAAWYLLETELVTASPWIAVGLGVVIALAVRLGAGRAEPELRAVLSAVWYLSTVLITVYFIERHSYQATYGRSPSLSESQADLVRDRLKHAWIALSWLGGLMAAMYVSYVSGYVRRRR